MDHPVSRRTSRKTVIAAAPIGNGGVSEFMRVNGRAMAFNGRDGGFLPTVDPDFAALLDLIADHGGWDDGLLNGEKPTPELKTFIDQWLVAGPNSLSGGFESYLNLQQLIVFPATSCNMACSYCSNGRGAYSGRETAGLMTVETAENFGRWLKAGADGHLAKDTQLILLGGEPTLAVDACVELIRTQHSNTCGGGTHRVKLTTNGLVIEERLLTALSENTALSLVGFSLDGDAERHDRFRPDTKGQNTFARIVENLERVRRKGLRTTVTAVVPYPFDFIGAFKELEALGFERIELKAATVNAHNAEFGLRVLPDDWLEIWREQYLAYSDFLIDNIANGQDPAMSERRHIVHQTFQTYGGDGLSCDAGTKQLALAPDGRVYPCDRFFGRDDYVMGDFAPTDDAPRGAGLHEDSVQRYHHSVAEEGQIVHSHPLCKSCVAREMCRGGCYGHNLDALGNISAAEATQCAQRRDKLRIDLYYIARLAEVSPTGFQTLGGRIG
ncbi:radical SAM protein [Magnetovibrio sp. PR-2]|uniref:radical SAM/SPASM domain-containing protein n=1 Tax=Magnetovibrio sp. PR-2 TaxID=3120356 RepID=UPI002FCDEAD1